MEQEGNVVARNVKIALVGFCGPGHRVQILDLRTIGIMNDLSIFLVADAEDLVEGLSLRELHDGVVKLAAADEVERGALIEGAVRVGGDWRPDKAYANGRIRGFDGFGEALVAFPSDGRSEQDQELVVLANLDGFVCGD